jgi:hypothetical protein
MDLCYSQPGGGGTRLYLSSAQVRALEVASTASANGRIADVVVPVRGGQLAGDHVQPWPVYVRRTWSPGEEVCPQLATSK